MAAVLFLFLFAQRGDCGPDAMALVTEASARAAALDVPGAAVSLAQASGLGCAEADIAGIYLRGLTAAQAASALGGSAESLQPVDDAVAALQRLSPRHVSAGIARDVLMAAAAAAQSERDQMSLYLLQALQLESLQLIARQPPAPMISAHEMAGELWLRVYRYAEARQAFLDAFKAVGPTRRVLLGLARAEARAARGPGACPDTQATCP
jgi:hypothetical protein